MHKKSVYTGQNETKNKKKKVILQVSYNTKTAYTGLSQSMPVKK